MILSVSSLIGLVQPDPLPGAIPPVPAVRAPLARQASYRDLPQASIARDVGSRSLGPDVSGFTAEPGGQVGHRTAERPGRERGGTPRLHANATPGREAHRPGASGPGRLDSQERPANWSTSRAVALGLARQTSTAAVRNS
jgi:hypothetical protein